MKKSSLWLGALVGGVIGVMLVALLYLGNQAFGLPFVPYDFWNWQARVVPGNALSLLASSPGTYLARALDVPESAWGEASERIVALLISVLVPALGGLGVAWLRQRTERAGRLLGAAAGGLLFAAVAAMELYLRISLSPVIALLWLALTFLGWGFSVGLVLDGHVLADLQAEADLERRRGLLKLVGGVAGATLAAWGLGSLLGSQTGESEADQPLAGITPGLTPTFAPTTVPDAATPTPAPDEVALPTGDDERILPAPGTREELTPRGEFYTVDIAATPPRLDGTRWRLVMAGMLDETPRLTLSELRQYPVHTQPITLSCISNPVGGSAISSAYWTGLRLRDLLQDLGLSPEAQYLHIQAADGFYETVPFAVMMDDRTLLVYGMNDRTLPEKHGFPLRIFIPDRFGMKQPKWIERIAASDQDEGGYWTDRGWSKQAIARTTSVIDTIAVDERHDGFVPVGGIAWAGARGIQKVEVQVDDGPWVAATLRVPPLGPLTWVQWRYAWPATSGKHTLRARATDGEGNLQIAEESGSLPNGATGYHTKDVTI